MNMGKQTEQIEVAEPTKPSGIWPVSLNEDYLTG